MEQEKFNFNEAYQELEQINEWFQGEDIDLDQAIKKFERGMELIEKCKKQIEKAENKFEEIKGKYQLDNSK